MTRRGLGDVVGPPGTGTGIGIGTDPGIGTRLQGTGTGTGIGTGPPGTGTGTGTCIGTDIGTGPPGSGRAGALEKAEGKGSEQVCKIERPTIDKKPKDKLDSPAKNPYNPPDGERHQDEQKAAGLQLPLVSPIHKENFGSNNFACADLNL